MDDDAEEEDGVANVQEELLDVEDEREEVLEGHRCERQPTSSDNEEED